MLSAEYFKEESINISVYVAGYAAMERSFANRLHALAVLAAEKSEFRMKRSRRRGKKAEKNHERRLIDPINLSLRHNRDHEICRSPTRT
jgi:hypothetical protein